MSSWLRLVLLLGPWALAGCGSSSADPASVGGGDTGDSGSQEADATTPPDYGYRVVKRYPHDPAAAKDPRGRAYTQGLFIDDEGRMFESTGRKGQSTVREVELETGKVLRSRALDSDLFGEGIAPFQGLVVMLTWQENTAIVFDRQRLKEQYRYTYEGEGWGLAYDGEHFWMSDGTPTLRVMDPDGFKELRTVDVTYRGQPLPTLNELEWIEGELWANLWQTDFIARIDPKTGEVLSRIDCRGILGDYRVRDPRDDVLNGIAWDAKNEKLYLTGKRWPWVFEVELIDKKTGEVVPIKN